MSTIDEAVALWDLHRKGVVAELENIPEERWDYRPGAGARTLRELALHIAAFAVGFTNELLSSETVFMNLTKPEVQAALLKPWAGLNSKAEIIKLLTSSGAEISQRLRSESAMLSTKSMKLMSGEQSRLSGLWFAISHETYHRGQLATYARGIGLTPAMTKQSQAPPKA